MHFHAVPPCYCTCTNVLVNWYTECSVLLKMLIVNTDNIYLWLCLCTVFRRGPVLRQQAVLLQLLKQLPQHLLHHKQPLMDCVTEEQIHLPIHSTICTSKCTKSYTAALTKFNYFRPLL